MKDKYSNINPVPDLSFTRSDWDYILKVSDPSGKPARALDTQVGGGHYKSMAIQPVEFCQKNRLNHCESSIIKYICRHKNKNGIEDLKKIIHYVELLIELEYSESN